MGEKDEITRDPTQVVSEGLLEIMLANDIALLWRARGDLDVTTPLRFSTPAAKEPT